MKTTIVVCLKYMNEKYYFQFTIRLVVIQAPGYTILVTVKINTKATLFTCNPFC